MIYVEKIIYVEKDRCHGNEFNDRCHGNEFNEEQNAWMQYSWGS